MDNFEEGQSKYGRIYKVAGPRKYSSSYSSLNSGGRREHVRLQDVRARQDRLGQAGRRDHQARGRHCFYPVL